MTAKYTSFRFQIPSDSFTNVPGALLNFYEAGTLNPVVIYANAALSVTLSNPVEADGFGLFPDIFLVPDIYDIVATDEDDVQIWTSEDYEVVVNSILDPNYFDLIDGEYVPAIAVNNQTGTGYTLLDSDRATLITFDNAAGGTITLPAPSGTDFPDKWFVYLSNIGSGNFTITSVANINGAANYALSVDSFTLLVSDGSTYFAGASANYSQIFTKTGGTRTIAAGSISAAGFSQWYVDTEAGAPTDDLDTITAGIDGKELVLQLADATHNVVIKSGTGNIINPLGADIILDTITDNVLLRYDDGQSAWIVQASSVGNPYPQVSKFAHEVSSGTSGGSATSAAWTQRPINTTSYNNITGASLASNQVTLPVGTYYMTATSKFYSVAGAIGGLKSKIVNTTDTADVAFFETGAFTSASTCSIMYTMTMTKERVVVTGGPKVFEMQYYIQATAGGDGLGFPYAAPGTKEVYASWIIEKVS